MKKKCHFIGIGGIGMSGLARILLARKNEVSGSDLASNYVTEELTKSGAQIYYGHAAHHVPQHMTVVYSSDIKESNPEYQQALSLKCDLLHRSEMLRDLMQGYKALAVAGTHGKTTTSSLLTSVLLEAGLDPTFVVGGIISQFKSNAQHGEGDFFVLEADESDGTFLNYHPFGAIITNIDFDHMNFFKDEQNLIKSFASFASQIISYDHFFWCGEDARLKNLNLPGFSYGFNEDCRLKGTNFTQKNWTISIDVHFEGHIYQSVEVSLIGRHNALNALAVFGLALKLGIPEEKIRHALKNFKGVGRRCEKKGEVGGTLFLDDYAHHPTEIETTIQGIRKNIGNRRLIGLFQPHRYSRIKDCLGTFGTVFNGLDELIITDIYGAGETPVPGLTYKAIFDEIESQGSVPIQYIPRNEIKTALPEFIKPFDVVVTLGAGDITKACGEIIHEYEKKNSNKIKVGVIFGGHDENSSSIDQAQKITKKMSPEYYDVVSIGITDEGKWIFGPRTVERLNVHQKLLKKKRQDEKLSLHVLKELLSCDLLVLTPLGQAGINIEGFCELLGKPCISGNDCLNAKDVDNIIINAMAVK